MVVDGCGKGVGRVRMSVGGCEQAQVAGCDKTYVDGCKWV